jgi:hypothetical protein
LPAKVFWLHPCNGGTWRSPDEVLARLSAAFDHVKADRNEARSMGEKFLKTYRALMEYGLGDANSVPLEVVERQWRDAVLLDVSDNSEATAEFQVIVRSEHKLELQFPVKSPYQKKRRSAEKAAKALDYTIEHFDVED